MGEKRMEEARGGVSLCVSDARRDIWSPSFAWRDSGTYPRCQQQWQHHQQNGAVARTHTHTHILLLSHLRKTFQMCLGNCSAPGEKITFSPFVTNKQLHTFHPHSIMSRFRLGRAAGPAWKSLILGGKFSCPLYLWAIKPITAKWN